MSESLFEAFGVSADDVSENPYSISDPDVYACQVTSAEVKSFPSNPALNYLVFEYTITEGKHAGKTANSMHRLAPWTEQERAGKGSNGTNDYQAMNTRLLSNYKKELLALGVPEAALNQFKPSTHAAKLVGIKGKAFFGPQKNNPEYNTVARFERPENGTDDSPVESPTNVSTPTAPANTEVDLAAIAGWNT